MKRILIFTAALVFIAGLTTVALAQQGMGMGGPGGNGPGRMDRDGFGHGHGLGILACQKELELTDDQMAKIKDINFAHQNVMIDLKARLEKAHLKMKQERLADNPNKASVLAVSKEINVIEGQIDEARINHQFDIRALLNADQLAKWKQCRMECGPRGMERGFRGMNQDDRDDSPGRGDMRRDGSCLKGK